MPASEEPRLARGFSFSEPGESRLALLLGIPLGLLYVLGMLALRGCMPLTDEADHHAQITLLLRGRHELWPTLTTIPGYHVATALLARITGDGSLDAARWINAGYGLLAIAGFHALRRRIWPGTQSWATAQFMLLPVLAPLFFVVYTDVLALALLLWAAWAAVAGRIWASALLMALLVGVRQHEVVWLGLVVPLAGMQQDASEDRRGGPARALSPFLLPLAGFFAFWLWNGSISLSTEQAALHPDFGLHGGNIGCALLVAGLLLPLHVLAGMRRYLAPWRAQPWRVLLPFVLALAFWFGFQADNPYNTVFPDYYLHNRLVQLIQPPALPRACAAVAFALAACGLAQYALRPRAALALWPVAALFLAGSWLVELRYAMVPLVMWLALRAPAARRIEYATLALWALLAVLLCHAVATHRLFL